MKAFNIYKLFDKEGNIKTDGKFHKRFAFEVKDPEGEIEESIGFRTPVIVNEADGGMCSNDYAEVVILSKSVPSSAIKRHVRQAYEDELNESGYELPKNTLKDIADEYYHENIVNAPIVEKVIPCRIVNEYLFIGTSSPKVADKVKDLLERTILRNEEIDLTQPEQIKKDNLSAKKVTFEGKLHKWLNAVFVNEVIKFDDYTVAIGEQCKIFNPENEKVVTVKKDFGMDLANKVFDDNCQVKEARVYIDGSCNFNFKDTGIASSVRADEELFQEMESEYDNKVYREVATEIIITGDVAKLVRRIESYLEGEEPLDDSELDL